MLGCCRRRRLRRNSAGAVMAIKRNMYLQNTARGRRIGRAHASGMLGAFSAFAALGVSSWRVCGSCVAGHPGTLNSTQRRILSSRFSLISLVISCTT